MAVAVVLARNGLNVLAEFVGEHDGGDFKTAVVDDLVEVDVGFGADLDSLEVKVLPVGFGGAGELKADGVNLPERRRALIDGDAVNGEVFRREFDGRGLLAFGFARDVGGVNDVRFVRGGRRRPSAEKGHGAEGKKSGPKEMHGNPPPVVC